jgi:hypothetical protein
MKLAGSQSSIGRELKIHQIYDADVTKNFRYYHSFTSLVGKQGQAHEKNKVKLVSNYYRLFFSLKLPNAPVVLLQEETGSLED